MDTQCSCIRGVLDFSLCHQDCSKVVYCDLSDWMEESYYTIPTSYTAQITTPKGVTRDINFVPKSCTVLTAEELTGNSVIADGVYCITVDNCGTVYKKTFALLPNMRESIDKLYLEPGNEEVLMQLERYMKYIEVNAMFDQEDIAKEYFNISSKILDRIDC